MRSLRAVSFIAAVIAAIGACFLSGGMARAQTPTQPPAAVLLTAPGIM